VFKNKLPVGPNFDDPVPNLNNPLEPKAEGPLNRLIGPPSPSSLEPEYNAREPPVLLKLEPELINIDPPPKNPPSMSIKLPSDIDDPAENKTEPPVPLSPVPTTSSIEPPKPENASPDIRDTLPLDPDAAGPDASVTFPEEPDIPAWAVSNNKLPLFVTKLSPAINLASTPSDLNEGPADNFSDPPM